MLATAQVIELDTEIRPKTARRLYKRHPVVVTYDVATKDWRWEVKVVQTLTFDGHEKTLGAAFRAAERKVDRVIDVQRGVG